ncbi:hypothetical protein TraAM80_08351, partial [Trypanosoma rangeli]
VLVRNLADRAAHNLAGAAHTQLDTARNLAEAGHIEAEAETEAGHTQLDTARNLAEAGHIEAEAETEAGHTQLDTAVTWLRLAILWLRLAILWLRLAILWLRLAILWLRLAISSFILIVWVTVTLSFRRHPFFHFLQCRKNFKDKTSKPKQPHHTTTHMKGTLAFLASFAVFLFSTPHTCMPRKNQSIRNQN